MITQQQLTKLGFIEGFDIYTGKIVYVLGEEESNICGTIVKTPIIYYHADIQTSRISRGEFCSFARICSNIDDLIKFIYCINFLFNLSITYNNPK